MYAKESVDLALYRMEKAEECLTDARDNLQMGKYSTAANRSYYAIFNAMRALLNLEGRDFKRHSGVISEFRRMFIKTGVLEPRFSAVIRDAFDLRNASDYDDFYIISKERVKAQTEDAATFTQAVRRCLAERVSNNRNSGGEKRA